MITPSSLNANMNSILLSFRAISCLITKYIHFVKHWDKNNHCYTLYYTVTVVCKRFDASSYCGVSMKNSFDWLNYAFQPN